MPKQSAGILVYRKKGKDIEVLLAHPGGPFWAKKDKGAWSIPKGEFSDDEQPVEAAYREFQEELGQAAPQGTPVEIGSATLKSGKTIYAWVVEGDLDVSNTKSNLFEMEWPPKSGEKQQFPEIDKAQWFLLDKATIKIHAGQLIFIERLAEKLGNTLPIPPQQSSLF